MHIDPFRPNNQNFTLPYFVNSKENILSLLKDTNKKHLVLIYIGKTLYNFILILLYIFIGDSKIIFYLTLIPPKLE